MVRGAQSAYRAAMGLVVLAAAGAPGCAEQPQDDTLTVTGTLEREGVSGADLTAVPVRYASVGARGEWWSCELRLTAGGCVGDHHMNVWVTLPEAKTFAELGGAGCVDAEGNPFGAYEQLVTLGEDPLTIGEDVGVLVLVASDNDGDAAADLGDSEETSAASILVDGTLRVRQLSGFDAPVALTVEGNTVAGGEVRIDVAAPTAPQPVAPPLDVPRTCVPGDLREP